MRVTRTDQHHQRQRDHRTVGGSSCSTHHGSGPHHGRGFIEQIRIIRRCPLCGATGWRRVDAPGRSSNPRPPTNRYHVNDEGQWYDPDSSQYGPTYPYTDSLITAQRVLNGDRISRGRSDIEAEFAPIAPAPPVALGHHGELVITTAEEVSDALNGHPISRTLPTRAGHIITADVTVRDAIIGAALEHTQAAAELWTHIARRLRGQPRAEALTIAAVAYCLLGDGIATQTALDEAEAAQCTAPRLALLLTALRSGMPPQQIRRVIANSALKPSQD
jgi:Domain of unknown function (DUF4192)